MKKLRTNVLKLKLKKHHYILGGLGIAIITLIAGIFGFQNIGTYAQEGYDITCERTGETTPIGINQTGDITLICDTENGENISELMSEGLRNILNNIISISGSSITGETDIFSSTDSVINKTFYYTGIDLGNSQYIIDNGNQTNQELKIREKPINIRITRNNTINVASICHRNGSPTIYVGQTGEIELICSKNKFIDQQSIINYIQQTNQNIISNLEISYNGSDEEEFMYYTIGFSGENTGDTRLSIEGTIEEQYITDNGNISEQIRVIDEGSILCRRGEGTTVVLKEETGHIELMCDKKEDPVEIINNLINYTENGIIDVIEIEYKYHDDEQGHHFDVIYSGTEVGETQLYINGEINNTHYTDNGEYSDTIEVIKINLDTCTREQPNPQSILKNEGGKINLNCYYQSDKYLDLFETNILHNISLENNILTRTGKSVETANITQRIHYNKFEFEYTGNEIGNTKFILSDTTIPTSGIEPVDIPGSISNTITVRNQTNPIFNFGPDNVSCTNDDTIEIRGSREENTYDGEIIGFDASKISTIGGGYMEEQSLVEREPGKYTWIIHLTGGELTMTVNTEGVHDSQNSEEENKIHTGTYYRDIYGPEISTTSLSVNECTNNTLNVIAEDKCGISGYNISGNIGNIGNTERQENSTFEIDSGRTSGAKIGTIYTKDIYGNQTQEEFTLTINNIPVTIQNGTSENTPYQYSTNLEGTTQIAGIIGLLGAREGECGTEDLIIKEISCPDPIIGDIIGGTDLKIELGDIQANSEFQCEITISDNEESTVKGYMNFTVSADYNQISGGDEPDITEGGECLTNRDNDYFLTGGFWEANPCTGDIINAIIGSEDDPSAYMDTSCIEDNICGENINVIFTGELPEVLQDSTIYVINTPTVKVNNTVILPKCTAIISNQTGGKDSTLYSDNTLNGIINMSGNCTVLDNISVNGSFNSTNLITIPNSEGSNSFNGNNRYNRVLNVVKVYNSNNNGIYIQSNIKNLINNIQSFNNKGAGILFSGNNEKNYLSNTQTYRNTIGVYIINSNNQNIDNVNIYSNEFRGLNIEGNSNNNHFNNMKLYYNNYFNNSYDYQFGAIDIYQDSGLLNYYYGNLTIPAYGINGYANDPQYDNTYTQKNNRCIGTATNQLYGCKCKDGGHQIANLTESECIQYCSDHYGYVGIGYYQLGHTTIQTETCTQMLLTGGRDELNNYTTGEIKEIDNSTKSDFFTNPKNQNDEKYLYTWGSLNNINSKGKNINFTGIVKQYSYGQGISKQKQGNYFGKIDNQNYIGSNVVAITGEIKKERQNDNKLHYIITGNTSYTNIVNYYSLLGTIPEIGYGNWINNLTGINIGEATEIYLGNDSTTTIIMQMYNNGYFATHVQDSIIIKKPYISIENQCVDTDIFTVTGTWIEYVGFMSGFDSEDLQTQGIEISDWSSNNDNSIFTWTITLNNSVGQIYIPNDIAEDEILMQNTNNQNNNYGYTYYKNVAERAPKTYIYSGHQYLNNRFKGTGEINFHSTTNEKPECGAENTTWFCEYESGSDCTICDNITPTGNGSCKIGNKTMVREIGCDDGNICLKYIKYNTFSNTIADNGNEYHICENTGNILDGTCVGLITGVVMIDNAAPKISGEIDYNIVNINISDKTGQHNTGAGIYDIQYTCLNENIVPDMNTDWTILETGINAIEYEYSFAGGENCYDKYLWIKSTDNVGNTKEENIGEITKDITCNENWDNDYFINPEFWNLNPSSGNIICALYGSGGDDQTAYTLGWSGYTAGVSCSGINEMNVVFSEGLPSTLLENTIYVVTGEIITYDLNLPKCTAIISNQTGGKDTTIITTENYDINIDSNYTILDNLSITHKGKAGNSININGKRNTLNVIKIYNRETGINVKGRYNMLNNIQSYSNNIGITLVGQYNAINNSQIYRNNIGLNVEDATDNIIYNTETTQNNTGLNIVTGSNNNTFKDIKLQNNKMNAYVLSGLNNTAEEMMLQYPITHFVEYSGKIFGNENERWMSEISGFDRVISKSDLETYYTIICVVGEAGEFTGINENDIVTTGEYICQQSNRGAFSGYTTRTDWLNYIILSETPIFNSVPAIEYRYRTIQYPNNMTNPKNDIGIYLNNFYGQIETGYESTFDNGRITKEYSYGYDISKQEDTKLWNGNTGGKIKNKSYFIGSNVQRYDIYGDKHTRNNSPTEIHYILTGRVIGPSPITHYDIKTNLSNIVSTILSYTGGDTREQEIETERLNIFTGHNVGSGVDLYLATGDTNLYPVVVQMYESGNTNNLYFAEHKYAGELHRVAPTFSVRPTDFCRSEDILPMTGKWNIGTLEYDITGFTVESINVAGNATGAFLFERINTGTYIRQIELTGGTGIVTVNTGISEDILQFQNDREVTIEYYRDIYGPEISNTVYYAKECKQKGIEIDADDYCAGVSGYKIDGMLGEFGWQASPIFRIETGTIGRTGRINITGTAYSIDNFGNTGEEMITITIENEEPKVIRGTGAENPYEYLTGLTGEITVENIIELLGAYEGNCGIDDLILTGINCYNDNVTGRIIEGTDSIYIELGDIATGSYFTCEITISDNENSTGAGYIKFKVSDDYERNPDPDDANNKPTCTITGTEMVTTGQVGTITVTCTGEYGINTTELYSGNLTYSGTIISVSDSSNIETINSGIIFTFTFTGENVGISNLALNTGVVESTLGITNNYTIGNDIEVVSQGSEGIGTHDCYRGLPIPQIILTSGTGMMGLVCETNNIHIPGLLQNSGNSVTGILTNNESADGNWTLNYTGMDLGTTYYALSGFIGDVRFQTNPYRSSGIKVIDPEDQNNKPHCTITGTEMVTTGQAGTITVSCTSVYGIQTTHLTGGDLDYSGDIISVSDSNTIEGTGNEKTFTFTFTGDNVGISNLALNTGVVKTTILSENSYITGNDIEVVSQGSGGAGTHDCYRGIPNPQNILTGGTGTMGLVCETDNVNIPGLLQNSGNSVTGILSNNDSSDGIWTLNYTGMVTGTTYYAISGTIGNVLLQTNPYRSSGINVNSEGSWDTILKLTLTPEIAITNQEIEVSMSGENANWVKYYQTGNNEITFEQCKGYGISLTGNSNNEFTGEITITDTGTTYIYLCGEGTDEGTGLKIGTYTIDTTKPECEIAIDPTEWTNSGVTLSVNINEEHPALYSWTGYDISNLVNTTGTKIVYETGTYYFYMVDAAGNTGSCSTGVNNIDNTEPIGDITQSGTGILDNGCTGGSIILTLSGSDNNGLAELPFARNSTGENAWTGNNTKIVIENESGTGYIKDIAGNILAIPYNVTGISHTGPTIILNQPRSGAILTGYVKFTWNLTTTNPICQTISGGYIINVYSGISVVYSGNTTATQAETTLLEGYYTWKVRTTDILGHTTQSETRPFIIREGAPTCNIQYTPAEGVWTSGNVHAILTGCTEGTTGFNETGHRFERNGIFEFRFENRHGTTGNAIANVRWIDKDPPILEEIAEIGETEDRTPDYIFSSTESGTIIYGGACSSRTTHAISGENTITFYQLEPGIYNDCTIVVVDRLGNASEVLNVSPFKIITAEKDDCPDGDYSDNFYDGTCEGSNYSNETRNICKVDESIYDNEMKLAYIYSYTHNITTMCPIDSTNLYGSLRRDHLAKILSQYAMNVLGLKPEIGKEGCDAYNDIAHESNEMKYFMKTACELGLMGLKSDGDTPMESFYPHGKVTRAEFGTTLSRLIYGDKFNLESEKQNTYKGAWYSKHLPALKEDGIMTKIDGDRPQHYELRGYVMLMLMRHGKARIENVKNENLDLNSEEEVLSMYNNNKELTCNISYFDSYLNYGSGVLYVQNNKIREDITTTKEGSNSTIIRNNKIYVRGDSTPGRKGLMMEYETTTKEILQELLENENYELRNCKSSIRNNNVFEIPDNINFRTVEDRSEILEY